MGYLENFARKPKGKEKSIVLTARLPESLYDEFKDHCEDLGLSISEAVFLLVEKEMRSQITTYEDKKNNDLVVKTTKDDKPKTVRKAAPTTRFTTKPWQVEGDLPCPICGQWVSSSNFSRHSKQHGTNTHAIFTNEDHLKTVDEMIKKRTALV
jgi:antitoxin component of RelBE/YafQ-DinJ toxin-antitoxin module